MKETKYFTPPPHTNEYSNTCLDTVGILAYDSAQLRSHLLGVCGMFACVCLVDGTLHTKNQCTIDKYAS